ncbi:hypothetical protein E2C01_003376 [Portunus trituberculatus]|uniref:Uncharacterized protein n=1 Tax=Portunus trituberculatus TaxID=210409 RepID=A0A5B7CQW9_PORTR|nr:hypothetical protein [Portunus trituberculatus]
MRGGCRTGGSRRGGRGRRPWRDYSLRASEHPPSLAARSLLSLPRCVRLPTPLDSIPEYKVTKGTTPSSPPRRWRPRSRPARLLAQPAANVPHRMIDTEQGLLGAVCVRPPAGQCAPVRAAGRRVVARI